MADEKDREKETSEWVGVSPFVDSLQCKKCGYQIINEDFRTPHCPWCGKEMTNFPWEDDDDDSESNNT